MKITQLQNLIQTKLEELERLDQQYNSISLAKRIDINGLTDSIAQLLSSSKSGDTDIQSEIADLEKQLAAAQVHNASVADHNVGRRQILEGVERRIKTLEAEVQSLQEKLKESAIEAMQTEIHDRRTVYAKALDEFLKNVAAANELSEQIRTLSLPADRKQLSSCPATTSVEVTPDYQEGTIRIRMLPGLTAPSNGSYLFANIRHGDELPKQGAVEKLMKKVGIDKDLLPG